MAFERQALAPAHPTVKQRIPDGRRALAAGFGQPEADEYRFSSSATMNTSAGPAVLFASWKEHLQLSYAVMCAWLRRDAEASLFMISLREIGGARLLSLRSALYAPILG